MPDNSGKGAIKVPQDAGRLPTVQQLRTLINNGNSAEAAALFDGLDLDAEPDAELLYYAGVCLGSTDRPERAIELLLRAVSGGFAPFWCAYHLGLFETKRGKAADAAFYLSVSLILEPERTDLLPLLAQLAPDIDLDLLRATQNGTGAENAAKSALDRGQAMLAAGQSGDAAAQLTLALALGGGQEARTALLQLAPEIAVDAFPVTAAEPPATGSAAAGVASGDTASAAASASSLPSLLRLQQLADTGKYRELLALLDGFDLATLRPDMQYLAGFSLGGLGQIERAVELLKRALDSGFPAFWCTYNLAQFEQRRGNLAKAGFYYTAALIHEPARTDLWPLLERIARGVDVSLLREAQAKKSSTVSARSAFDRAIEQLDAGNLGAAGCLLGTALALDPLHEEARSRLLGLAADLPLQCITGIEFDRLAAEMQARLEDPAGSLEQRLDVADWAGAVYAQTWHASGVALIPAIQRVFQDALAAAPTVGIDRLCGIYESLYFLHFYMASHQTEMRSFADQVVRPFAAAIREGTICRDLPPVTPRPLGNQPWRIAYLSQYASISPGNAVGFFAHHLLHGLARYFPDSYRLALYAWREYDEGWLTALEESGILVRRFAEYSTSECIARVSAAIAADAIDVLITDQNTWLPTVLFERRVAPIQIHNNMGGLPFWPLENIDAVFRIDVDDPSVEGLDLDKCFPVGLGPWDLGWLAPPVDSARVAAERERFPTSPRLIGNYGRLAKITPDFLSLAAELVGRHPDVVVVLGGQGGGSWIREFINKRDLSERILVIDEWVDGHVWGHLLEVFLDTFPTQGGASRREVMAKGRPVVSMQSPWTQFEGVPMLTARDRHAYIAIVDRLLTDPSFYAAASSAVGECAASGMSAYDYAATINEAILTAVDRVKKAT